MADNVRQLRGTAAPGGWTYERIPPMGGATGEAFTNTLASSGMAPAAVLAREAVQNSVDARGGGDAKVRIDFVAKSLTGRSKKDFVAAADLEAIAARSGDLGFKEPNCASSLREAKRPLSLLYVDDYNTTGLAGDPRDPDSRFSRFLLSLGDGGKEHSEHGTGGSYGFGKSVYSSNSGILTIFAYTRSVDGEGRPMSLLFGCGYFRKHRHDGGAFTGRAWYGVDETADRDHSLQVVSPLLGAEADAAAARLGFAARAVGELGTSVLLVDAQVDVADILRGVEDWWWPRLLSNLLDVRVIDAEGEAAFPRPRRREDLRPFLDAFETASGKSPANGRTSFRKAFNRSEGLAIGESGFVVLDRDEDGEFHVAEERIDSVALVRAPLMVVAYYRQWAVGSPAMVGAFVAEDDVDDVLRAAEPPAHDRWDRDARRLQDSTGRNRAIVDKVLNGIKRGIKQCQGAASPPPPPRPKRLSLLERSLASFLAPSKTGSGAGSGPSAAPIHLTYEREPVARAEGGFLRLAAGFAVRLKADEDVDAVRIRVRVSCPVVEDGQTGDSVPVDAACSVEAVDDPDRPGWRTLTLNQGETVRFDCVSDEYDPLWTVRFNPEVEAVGATS